MSASRRRDPAPLGGAWMLLFGCWSSRRFLLPILIRLRNDEGDPLGRPRKNRYTARELAIAPPDEGFREAEPDDAPARVPHPAAPRARCAGGEGGCGIRERVGHRLLLVDIEASTIPPPFRFGKEFVQRSTPQRLHARSKCGLPITPPH